MRSLIRHIKSRRNSTSRRGKIFHTANEMERQNCSLFSHVLKLRLGHKDWRLGHPEMDRTTASGLQNLQQPRIRLDRESFIERNAQFANQTNSSIKRIAASRRGGPRIAETGSPSLRNLGCADSNRLRKITMGSNSNVTFWLALLLISHNAVWGNVISKFFSVTSVLLL